MDCAFLSCPFRISQTTKIFRKMKNIKILLALFLLAPMGASAQKLKVENTAIDCGQVAYQTPASADFEITNTSNHTIRIKEGKTSCGCTCVDFPKDGVAPGETFSVRVTYDSQTMGHFDKLAALYSDAEDKPLVLHIKGVVVDEVVGYAGDFPYTLGQIKADRIDVEYDNVSRGEMPQQKIHILNTTGQTIQPQVMHLPNYIKAEVAPTKIKAGRDGVVTLTLDSRSLPDLGLNQTSVFLGAYPGDKVNADKEIDVSAVLLPNFGELTPQQLAKSAKIQLSTTEINVDPANSKKKVREVIVIRNVGKSPLDLTNLRMFTSALQVSLNKAKIEPNGEAKLKIAVDMEKLKTVRNKPRVLMITNDPNNPKVTINVNKKQ